MDQSASASAGQQTTESTMAMHERILDALQQLEDDVFKTFRWHLTMPNVEGLQPLKTSAMEHAERTRVVNQILQAYRGRETEIMQAILPKVNRNDLANTFGNKPTGPEPPSKDLAEEVIQRANFRESAVCLSLRHGHAGPPKGVRHVIQRANFRACAVCLLLLFLVAAAIIVHLTIYQNQLQREVNQLKSQVKSCPSGWTKFGCSCYYRTTGGTTWQEARQECQNQGADLVVINSGEEQVFLRGLKPGDYVSWIGLQRTGGTWAWLDGTPLTTQYWNARSPDNDGDCGLHLHRTDPGTWYNERCSYPSRAICEK